MESPNKKRLTATIATLLALWMVTVPAAFAGTEIHVTTTDDELNADGDCSLREAIRAANFDEAVDACPAGDGADVIVIPAGHYVLSELTGSLDVWSDVAFRGAGAGQTIVDGDEQVRVFIARRLPSALQNPRVSFSDLTITGGNVAGAGGGLVASSADVEMTDVVVERNAAQVRGGGIANSRGALVLVRSVVSENVVRSVNAAAASCGGGISISGFFDEEATLVLTESFVADNRAEGGAAAGDPPPTAWGGHGGGICSSDGRVSILAGSAISGNAAGGAAVEDAVGTTNRGGWGGGIYANRSETIVEESMLSGNIAGGATGSSFASGGNGGAIASTQGSLVLTECSIEDNTAGDAASVLSRAEAGRGGAIYVGDGSLQVDACTFTANAAGEGHASAEGDLAIGGWGGAIFGGSCELHVAGSTFVQNRAGAAIAPDVRAVGGSGGAVALTNCSSLIEESEIVENGAGSATGFTFAHGGSGGAIYANRTSGDWALSVRRTLILRNEAGDALEGSGAIDFRGGNGGGIEVNQVDLLVEESTLDQNRAGSVQAEVGSGGRGGGISGFASDLSVTGSTISRNATGTGSGGGDGGGIWVFAGESSVVNSTVSGNAATRHGGGIFGSLPLSFVTIADNVADADEDGQGDGGGLAGTAHPLRNSILAGNRDAGGEAPDCSNFVFTGGYNLIGDMTGCSFSNPGVTTDVTDVDARLGPLAENGGPTLTHLLLAGSPALLLVPPAACDASVDQRGYPRGAGGACDAGAVETVQAVTVDDLVAAIDQLAADEIISSGDRIALRSLVRAAQRAAGRGQFDAAIGALGAFLNKIDGMLAEGALPEAEHAALRAMALYIFDEWRASAEAAFYAGGEVASARETAVLPDAFALEGNYPNPFNPSTTIRFALPEASAVRLTVYDVAGREVARLVDGAMPAGQHEVRLEAAGWPSGVYLYRLEAGAERFARTMILTK